MAQRTPRASHYVRTHVRALGEFKIELEDAEGRRVTLPYGALSHARSRALAMLTVSVPGAKVVSSRALELLWPDAPIERARKRLSDAQSRLRAAIPESDRFLFKEGEWFGLRVAVDRALGEPPCQVDVIEFRAACARALSAPGEADRLSEATRAVELYSGELLPEAGDATWVLDQREHLRERWIAMALLAADGRCRAGALEEALDLLQRVLAVWPLHEGALARAMRLLMHLQRPSAALALFNQALRRARDELVSLPDVLYQIAQVARTGAPRKQLAATHARSPREC